MSLQYGQDIPLSVLISVATDAARQAEQRVIDVIHDAFQTHPILAEERGLTEQRPSSLQMGDRSS